MMRTLIAFLLLCGLMVAVLIVAFVWSSPEPQRGGTISNAAEREETKIDIMPAARAAETRATADSRPSAEANLTHHDPPPAAQVAPTSTPTATSSPRRVRGETRWPDDRASPQRRYANAAAALKFEPDNRNALRDAIDAALLLQDYEAAFALQQRFMELEPDDLMQRSRAARIALDLGRWLEAVELFNQCVAAQPDEPRHRFDLAVAHAALGHLHAAQSQWEAYLAIRPDDREARFHLGVTLLDLHEWQQAAEAFADLIRIDPAQPDVQLNLMLALQRLDRWADLVVATDEFVARNGPQAVVLNRAAELLWQTAEADGAPRDVLLQLVVSYAGVSLTLDSAQPAIRGLMQRAVERMDQDNFD
ncbi:MAG: tetratricopeptide repeat protein [Phycisphaerales bacterium]|nr:tetratricopeptide repeat protein [Phycisphaerales bacterium]